MNTRTGAYEIEPIFLALWWAKRRSDRKRRLTFAQRWRIVVGLFRSSR